MENLNYCEGTYTQAIWRPYTEPYIVPWDPYRCPCPCEKTCPNCGGTGRVPVRPRPRPIYPQPYIDTRPMCKPPYDPTRGMRY